MFAKPRPKKSILPPPSKKRKTKSSIEEITFDDDARHEFLTGFQKRKQQRIKHAQEQAAKQARQEKLDARKQMRDERRREIEQHVERVNQMLEESSVMVDSAEAGSPAGDGEDEWDGFPDKPNLDIVDHEEEYVDEDRYTTVTVETVSVSRDGLDKAQIPRGGGDEEGDEEEEDVQEKYRPSGDAETKQNASRPTRVKKKKFRYESKVERLTNSRRRTKSRRQN